MAQAVALFEIDVPRCTRTYGVSLCTAAIDDDNPIKCFNCYSTCQDTANFASALVTLRFSMPADYLNKDIEAIPCIKSFDYTPATIEPGRSLGRRASVSINFSEIPHSDTGPAYDSYLSSRGYIPFELGGHWGKFDARYPYLRGFPARLITGTADQALVDMETRHFIAETSEGPTAGGGFTIKAKDGMKGSDGDRALAPLPNSGSLVSSITDTATSATLTPSGIGDGEYAASGKMNLGGEEIAAFTRSGDVLTLARGQNDTVAAAHLAGTRCQECLEYVAVDPANVIRDLKVTFAGMDAARIPIAEWLDETQSFYGGLVTTLIPEPRPVNSLENELIEQCGLSVWWDDVGNEVKLQVLRAITTDARTFLDGDNIIKGSLSVQKQPSKRYTRVFTHFGLKTPLLDVSESSNYRSMKPRVDPTAEVAGGKSNKVILSRWIPFGGQPIATRLNELMLGRYREPPRKITFKVPRHNGQVAPLLGEGIQIQSHLMRDATGAVATVPAQIVRIKPGLADYTVVAEEMRFTSFESAGDTTRHIIIDNSASDLNLRTLHDALFLPPTGGEEVELTINTGVVISASSISAYGLTIGDWPELDTTADLTDTSAVLENIADDTADLVVGMYATGAGIPDQTKILTIDSSSQVTLDKNVISDGTGEAITFHLVRITVNQNGDVTGKGGEGAAGRGGDNNAGRDGDPGGDAIFTRHPILLNMPVDASIQAGAGAGGGGAGDYAGWGGPQYNGGGGGGGAGFGLAGSGASGAEDGEPGDLIAGGDGGNSNQSGSACDGGDGGDRAQGGQSGNGIQNGPSGGSGGDPGDAIDGWSYIEEGAVAGNYYGDKVN